MLKHFDTASARLDQGLGRVGGVVARVVASAAIALIALAAAPDASAQPTAARGETLVEFPDHEYLSGLLTEVDGNLVLSTDDGEVLPVHEALDSYVLAREAIFFAGKRVTLRGNRYELTNGKLVFGVTTFGPGDRHDFASGRLSTNAEGNVVLRTDWRTETVVRLEPALAARLRVHARTLPTAEDGDGVLLHGDLFRDASGALTLRNVAEEFWLLMRPHVKDAAPRMHHGEMLQLWGMQTPATTGATDGAYGHLELPVDAAPPTHGFRFPGDVFGNRYFVRGTIPSTDGDLAFKRLHPSIAFRGREVAGATAGMEHLTNAGAKRLPPRPGKGRVRRAR